MTLLNHHDFSTESDGPVTETNGAGTQDPATYRDVSGLGAENPTVLSGAMQSSTSMLASIPHVSDGRATLRVDGGDGSSVWAILWLDWSTFDGYSLMVLANGGWQLVRFDEGEGEILDSGDVGPISLSSTRIGLERDGTTWRGYIDGAEIAAETDSTYTTFDDVGVQLAGDGARVAWWAYTTGEDFNPDPILAGSAGVVVVAPDATASAVPTPTVITAQPATVAVFAPAAIAGAATLPPEPPDPEDPDPPAQGVVTVRMVGMGGGNPVALPLASVERITERLNEPKTCDLVIPKGSYTRAQVPVLANPGGPVREVQVFRDGALMHWGPIIGADVDGGDGPVRLRSAGVDWYLAAREIGAPRPNRLVNGDAENLGGWAAVNTAASVSTTRKKDGDASFRLAQSTPGADAYLHQAFFEQGTGVGTLLTVGAWVFVESITHHALLGRGLYVEGYGPDGQFRTSNYFPIFTTTFAPRVWRYLETTIQVPANQTWLIDVRLYSPAGVIHWDRIRAVRMESLSTAQPGNPDAEEDIAVLAGRAVREVQRPAIGKSDLRIGTSTPANGRKTTKHYQFVEHLPVMRALDEWLGADDGFDYSIGLTPTTRTFRTHSPRRGVNRQFTVALSTQPLGESGEIAPRLTGYQLRVVADDVATSVTVLGEGDGPDREEGYAVDASDVGGLILERTVPAPPGAEVSALDALAREELVRRPPEVLTLFGMPGDIELIHVVRPGDLVSVAFDDGWASVEPSVWRVVEHVWDARDDQAVLTVNREAA